MALPEGFTTPAKYFTELVDVLLEYQWLHAYPNTDIFVNDLLLRFPSEWTSFFKQAWIDSSFTEVMCNLRQGNPIPGAPDSLNNFMQKINSLKPVYKKLPTSPKRSNCIKSISLKKQHEIAMLAPLIQKLCVDNIDYVIDIGCGLGYLTRLLKEMNLEVMGIDGNAEFIETARKSHEDIPFEQLYLTSESGEQIIDLLSKNFKNFDPQNQNHRICLVGLHACADLTVDMLKLFVDLPMLKAAVMMPCCYHRMAKEHDSFKNFPLSKPLIDAINAKKEFSLNGTFLRLACQRRVAGSTEADTQNLMYRNLLQVIAEKNNFSIKRKRRKTGKKHAEYDLQNFLEHLSDSYEIRKGETLISDQEYLKVRSAIKKCHQDQYKDKEHLLAAFVELQNFIQKVCENLVLLDRCVFIESIHDNVDIARCKTVKVTNDWISPRCFALVASKNNHVDFIRDYSVDVNK